MKWIEKVKRLEEVNGYSRDRRGWRRIDDKFSTKKRINKEAEAVEVN
jgi:hypothetical protein